MRDMLERLCGSPLWDPTTFNSTRPDFTECFKLTLLSWLGIILLLTYLPFWIYSASKKTNLSIQLTFKIILKTSLITILSFIEFYKLLIAIVNSDPSIFKITPTACIICYLTIIWLIHLERSNGQRPSIFLFVWWLSNFLVASILIRSHILRLIKSVEEFYNKSPETTLDECIYKHRSYILDFFKYFLIVCSFCLSFLTENAPQFVDRSAILKHKEYPEAGACIWSRLTFSWLSKLIWKSSKVTLKKDSLWPIENRERSEYLTTKLERAWQPKAIKYLADISSKDVLKNRPNKYKAESSETELKSLTKSSPKDYPIKKPSLAMCILVVFRETFLAGGLLKLARDCSHLIMPLVLDKLIDFFQHKELNYQIGLFYSGMLFFCLTLRTFFSIHHDNKMAHLGVRIRTSLINLIYKKSLRLSCTSRRDSSIGEMTNLMATNANNFVNLTLNMHFIWSSPFQIIIGIFILWHYLGVASLAGLAVLISMVSVNVFFTDIARKLFIKKLTYQDSRMKMISELLSGIKIIKLYGWEYSFNKIIGKIRSVEVKYLTKSAILNCLFSFTWDCSPFFVSSASICTFVFINGDQNLDVNTVFVSLTIFELIKLPLTILPLIVSEIVQTRVSLDRIQDFLLREEVEFNSGKIDSNSDLAISLRDVDFGWYKNEEPLLKSIDLNIKKGSLIGVIGKVGSGKSSLLHGILNEMYIRNNGKLLVNGSVAYVSQQSWIQNDTVRNNILFGSKYDKNLYERVIRDCCLVEDFKLMPQGDQTEIGERGINLSGGQKQRISLARAVYSDSDIYLLDDPLSAVDSNVGSYIFEKVIDSSKGILKDKTRIFVTNLLHFLPDLDSVVILERGRIVETGKYSDIKNISLSTESETVKEKEQEASREVEPMKKQESVKGIVDEEKVETGNVQVSTFLLYIQSSHIGLFSFYILLNILVTSLIACSNFWLSDWSSHRSTYSTSTRLIVFNLIGLIQCAEANHTYMFVRAVKLLHDNMLFAMLRSKLSFFESTPSGRIINRFSKDISVLEKEIPDNLKAIISCFLNVLSVVIIISITTPLFIIALIPLIIAYIIIQRYFVACARQLKRLESTTRSPVFNHFSETLSGLTIVRAYKAEKRFIHTMEERIDQNLVYFYPNSVAYRWLAIRLEMIGNCITLFASVFSVFSARYLSEGLVALSISYSLTVPGALSWFVRTFSEFESDITSLERIKEYTSVPQEDAWEIKETKPSPDWPSKGEIEFRDFYLKYRPGLNYALKGLNFKIAPGQKIGIVGRTGAGKSSLTLGLFRLIDHIQGSILIDGVDISQIGLHDLRHKLTIIPQDPVIFSGSLRMNLDPYGNYSESELWNVIELTNLKDYVSCLENKLDYECSEGGENLSVGQRQLICLARALLRKTKVLIMDEATACVDHQTDKLIQSTLRSEFSDCTVLTIAHRLNTVMDSNMIMVLDNGELVEIGEPNQLLQNHQSLFYKMIKTQNNL